MDPKIADVTIHIDETLDEMRTGIVCDNIKHLHGVSDVRCAEHQPHLLIIDYDPETVNSHQILDKVSAEGLHAQLIGM